MISPCQRLSEAIGFFPAMRHGPGPGSPCPLANARPAFSYIPGIRRPAFFIWHGQAVMSLDIRPGDGINRHEAFWAHPEQADGERAQGIPLTFWRRHTRLRNLLRG